jgi:guanylate kinase
MPLPTLTDEQRKQALAKAAEARRARAELKAQLKAEKVSLRDVLSK